MCSYQYVDCSMEMHICALQNLQVNVKKFSNSMQINGEIMHVCYMPLLS